MSTKSEKLTTNPDIVLREEDEGAFLFDPDSGRICYLNDLGITIWKWCQESTQTERIVHAISTEYPEIAPERISEDCCSFLDDLQDFGFLTKTTSE
jgi:hypothetical protein